MKDSKKKPRRPRPEKDVQGTRPIGRLGRRSFLGGLGGIAAAAMATGFTGVLQPGEIGPEDPTQRRYDEFKRRNGAAVAERILPPKHPTNGDEERYYNKIANYSKGLPHDEFGGVNLDAYKSMINALSTGSASDFEAIPLSGVLKLTNPQAAYAYCLEGAESHVDVTVIPPVYAGNEQGSEMAECYWMALARDVAFANYDSDATVAAAVSDLSTFPNYRGPQPVTTGNIFRGFTPGDLIGPYISQFFALPISYGPQALAQQIITNIPGDDHMTSYLEWLNIQDGGAPSDKNQFGATPLYVRDLRDLTAFVHKDITYEEAFHAAIILNGMGASLDPNNPYLSYTKTQPFGTFGFPDVLDLLARVSAAALRCVFFQKWLVHRRIRPEAYGGDVHNQMTGQGSYPLPARLLSDPVLPLIYAKFGTYLLPMAYAEGCPSHPSFPQAHATLAGSTVTVLKAFYEESFQIPNPVVASADGTELLPYDGTLTVGDELNKLAANVARARDAAGVHWRSDGMNGLLLGEAIAIKVLKDIKVNYWESFNGWQLTKFDGRTITI